MPAWNWHILAVEKTALLSSVYRAITFCETKVVTSCWDDQAIYHVHMPTCSHTADVEGCKVSVTHAHECVKIIEEIKTQYADGAN